ncbi:MAG: creatininase family protein [Acidobacteria bacterium]|nr:MAG: creatininase family protein [Acidobacteriota bacterium]
MGRYSKWISLISSAVFFWCLFVAQPLRGQTSSAEAGSLPFRYEELTAPDFVKAVEKAGKTCIIPFGILEKHGPHLPLGTDLLDSRQIALKAAKQEYVLVFPEYYFGQIYEAKHQPGTIAYSPTTVWNLLQETCDELSRNGIKKIIIVNGHGGNTNFLNYFCQAQLAARKDYAVMLFTPPRDPENDARIRQMRKTTMEMHAGEGETSTIMAHRPELAHPERAKQQSGEDQARMKGIEGIYTAIWWYARFPNHYAGDGTPATKNLGEAMIQAQVEQLIKVLQTVKRDDRILELQERFYNGAEKPLETVQ